MRPALAFLAVLATTTSLAQSQQQQMQQNPTLRLSGRSKHFGKDGMFLAPGTTSLFQSPRTSSEALAWLQALPPRNGSRATGAVFFKHMRKAGGSTVRSFFEKNKGRQTVYKFFYPMEWGTFPVPCFDIEPQAIFVTAMRNPVERAFSEFRYGGAGRTLRRDNTTKLQAWMRPDKEAMQELSRGLKRGIYLDNYYTRSLTGRCLPRKHLDRVESEAPCRWGGAYGGGCRPEDIDRPADEAMAALASTVLARFDMCLALEWFDAPALTDWLRKKLGSPAEPLKRLGWERTSMVFGGNTYDMSGESRRVLTADNAHDLRLYQDCKSNALASMKELGVELNFVAPKDPTRRGPFRVVETITSEDIKKLVKKQNKRGKRGKHVVGRPK